MNGADIGYSETYERECDNGVEGIVRIRTACRTRASRGSSFSRSYEKSTRASERLSNDTLSYRVRYQVHSDFLYNVTII